MVRPCVARGFVDLADAVLHQCIRPLIGACCAPGHHGYQRACDLISGQASIGPFGSPVFACAGKTDPPSSSILSQTSAGKGCCATSSIAPLLAVPLFAPGGRSFVPACAYTRRRAQGPSRLAVAHGLASCSSVSRPCLDGPEHGATIKQVGTPSHRSCRIRSRAPC